MSTAQLSSLVGSIMVIAWCLGVSKGAMLGIVSHSWLRKSRWSLVSRGSSPWRFWVWAVLMGGIAVATLVVSALRWRNGD